jgi:hypothetical protein
MEEMRKMKITIDSYEHGIRFCSEMLTNEQQEVNIP